MRVVMTTTLAALLLSATVLLLFELRADRDSWAQDLRTQGDLLARASLPAQTEAELRAARENLALLQRKPQIDAAGLYDTQGRLLASYATPDQPPMPPVLPPGATASRFQTRQLELHQPVMQNGQLLGTVLLRAHYDLWTRLLDYLAMLGVVTLASLALAALVAQRLQRAITEPIVAIAAVAREVVQTRNFGLRAPRTTRDEVGALVDAFNDMLRELGGQAEALLAADRRKDEFLATLAHELRNPLAPIATALAILPRGDTDHATLRRMVDMMQRQMQQLVRLIDDLMEISRISTGRLTLRPERLDLVEVVRGAVESVAPALLERGHTLAASWPAPVWLEGDRTRLGQVFANLLSNAAKYTDPGGRIGICFELASDSVAVHVSDNGIGIPSDRQQHVFEMFTQLDRSLARTRAGLGVGLAVARQLVEMHQGRLQLHSHGAGQGSVFSVRLPCLAPQAADLSAAPLSPPLQPTPARPLHVLVADDNRDFADSLATALRQDGHHVRVAYDGSAALALARAELPEVGLFDIGMPGLDGYQLASALRSEPGGRASLLLAITGWGQQADQQRAHEAGFDEHLVKPVDMDRLLALLAKAA